MRLASVAGVARLPLLLAASLAVGVWLGGAAPGRPLREALLAPFPLERVAARGLVRVAPEELTALLGVPRGTSLARVTPAHVEERLRAHPWIREARALRIPPGGLLVSVVERTPVAVASAAPGDEERLVDVDGIPFARPEGEASAGLLRVRGVPADREDAALRLREALALAAAVERAGLPEATELSLAAGAEGWSLRLAGEPARIVLGGSHFDERLERLVRLRRAVPAPLADATNVDLRFAGRVVLRSGPLPDGGEATAKRGRATSSGSGRPG